MSSDKGDSGGMIKAHGKVVAMHRGAIKSGDRRYPNRASTFEYLLKTNDESGDTNTSPDNPEPFYHELSSADDEADEYQRLREEKELRDNRDVDFDYQSRAEARMEHENRGAQRTLDLMELGVIIGESKYRVTGDKSGNFSIHDYVSYGASKVSWAEIEEYDDPPEPEQDDRDEVAKVTASNIPAPKEEIKDQPGKTPAEDFPPAKVVRDLAGNEPQANFDRSSQPTVLVSMTGGQPRATALEPPNSLKSEGPTQSRLGSTQARRRRRHSKKQKEKSQHLEAIVTPQEVGRQNLHPLNVRLTDMWLESSLAKVM
jgi:hypothetical protein